MKSAASAGEGKSGAEKELAMRSAFSSAMQSRMLAEPLKMSAFGISDQSIGAFMDQKLVKEPLRDFLKQEAKNMRKNTQDLFRKQYGYSWDYVMVFKVHQEDVVLDDYQMTYSIRNILYSLAQGGLEIRLFYSVKVSVYILFKDILLMILL